MLDKRTFGTMRLVSSNDKPIPAVTRWIPPPLEAPPSAPMRSQAQQRTLAEVSDDIAILSLEAGKILHLLKRTGTPQTQSMRHLAERLEYELSELMIIAQSLQP